MITKQEKLKQLMFSLPSADVRAIFAGWDTITTERNQSIREILLADGFEEAPEAFSGAAALPDGREITRVDGIAYVLPIETHRARLADVMREAKTKQPAKHQKPGEGLTAVLCPNCQSIMAKQPVCPRCSKGKQGYKILCTCIECGHEVYL